MRDWRDLTQPDADPVRQVDVTGIEQPVMHACGHDVHMTSLVGTARQLAARKCGVVRHARLDRPAGGGDEFAARATMLADGLYTRFPKPDYALGFHVWSTARGRHDHGAADDRDVERRQRRRHRARRRHARRVAAPRHRSDPRRVADRRVAAVAREPRRSIRSRPAVVTVGAIHGGTKHNIIGDRVDLQLTVRADNYETRATLLKGIERIAHGVARSFGVPEDKLPEVIPSKTETTPPTLNHEPTAARIQSVFRAQFGDERVPPNRREGMGGEDFAFYGAPEHGVKAVFFFVGGTPRGRARDGRRASLAAVQDLARAPITTGIEAMVVGAMTLMPKR